MKSILRKIKNRLLFKSEFKKFHSIAKGQTERFSLLNADVFPCMNDNTGNTGFDRHYVYHTSWAARILKQANTKHHIDISSSLYFSGIVSAFIDVDFYDYRPADLVLSGLKSAGGDLNNLPWKDNSILSLSCMHTVEHIGLGRYGDQMDYNGDLKAIKELARVSAIGGNLIFVVPIGKRSQIQFNAHRIYTKDQVISCFNKEGMELKHFSIIPESGKDGGLIENPSDEFLESQNYACGCFVFTKN